MPVERLRGEASVIESPAVIVANLVHASSFVCRSRILATRFVPLRQSVVKHLMSTSEVQEGRRP